MSIRDNNETPLLLAKLQAQIDDDEDFSAAVQGVGGCTPLEFRGECRTIFGDLYDTAGAHWSSLHDPLENRWHPKLAGAAVVERHGPLHSCWIGNFSLAILNVAQSAETSTPDRDFLFFMLGILRCGWHEYLRQLSCTSGL